LADEKSWSTLSFSLLYVDPRVIGRN
jgi:hypothetical protein